MKNLRLFALLALLCFVFSSCSDTARLGLYHYIYGPWTGQTSRLYYPVYLDRDFGEADRLSIQDALDQWNIALHGQAQFVVVHDHFAGEMLLQDVQRNHGFLLFKITSHHPLVKRADAGVNLGRKNGGYWSVGFTSRLGSHDIYLVRDRLSNEDVKFIVMHELGHALGADHGGNGLMSVPYIKEKWRCIDRYTMERIAVHERLHAEDLNYCVVGIN